ncbi:hypothetical protein Ddye_029571 [Dipteronia dyeriana]|uniref:Ubiquitin-like protease family profile domain-containing protein n=1 Tax=Dipteronia dyeriana TaxID=168575 RepID=A0AAD9TEP0_9ROSI|nr:hypothetical protein Ddye_029571 [Dipteronia dyeriana]
MMSRLKDLLKTLEGDWFKGKLTRHDHFEALARIDDALNRVPEDFTIEDQCRFMAFCFGHFMSMHRELKFLGGVIHQLLLRELDHDGPTDEMRFLLGNHVLFAFEVIPQLGIDFGARRVTELSPRMLNKEIVPTSAEAVSPYFASQSEGGSLYVEDDRVLLPTVPDQTSSVEGPEEEGGCGRHKETETPDPSGPGFSAMDTDGSEPSPRPYGNISSTSCMKPSGRHTSAEGVRLERRVLKRGWQLFSPYTDPCRPKRARVILQGPDHVFDPHGLVEGDQLKAYRAFKKNINGELRDVDVLEPVDVAWFHRMQTNFMYLDDESYLEHQYRKMMPRDARGEITMAQWNVLRSWWKDGDLTTVLGGAPIGCRLWHEVDMVSVTWFAITNINVCVYPNTFFLRLQVLIPYNIRCQHYLLVTVDLTCRKMFIVDPWRQPVPVHIRKHQVAHLPWFLPSMLHQAWFHTARPAARETLTKTNKPFSVSVVSETRIPQQKKSGNCGPYTLRLIEYLLTNIMDFDWSEDDMGIIQEKMAVEIFSNSRPV